MQRDYDAIVVGLGAMGSAATYQLAKRGVRVLGLDMFPLGHQQGSSHGHHRMIRRSATRPEIDRMIAQAFTLWRELEAETDQNILNLIGEVALVDRGTVGARRRLGVHDDEPEDLFATADVTLGGRRELLDEAALRERFPGFRLHEGLVASYEAEAGFLRPEVGVAAHLTVAARHGATIHRPEEVTGWQADGAGVVVTTTHATYRAARLILTTGPWAAELLADRGLPLQVVRIVNAYFAPTRPDWWTSERGAPDFLLSVPEGSFYGMPSIEGTGVKIGRHDNGEATTARTIRRAIDPDEIAALRGVLDRYMPGASGPLAYQLTCMYTMTPDEQYIIEAHPTQAQVVYGCGCSGTSYKFSGVIGGILADLALTGRSDHDLAFLSSRRFATVGTVAAD